MMIIGFFACYSAYTDASQKVIVINPGHSLGYDTGATSDYKCEAQVNQELAGRVVRELIAKGYKVYITHTTDQALQQYKLLDQAGGSSLARVGAAANSVNPDLAMAIHHNSAGSSATGTELYWSSYRSFDSSGVYTVPGLWADGSAARRDSSPCTVATQSQQFAQIVQKNLNGMPNLPFRKTVERDDYLPAHATCPCILYEGGFLSNPSEAQYLASDAYQNEASRRIVAAIDEFFGGSGGSAPANDKELPKINSVSTDVTETGNSTYTVSANASDNVGVASVKVATWTEAKGQDDLIWSDMHNDGNGNWSYTVKVSDHKNETGIYINHVYAYDAAGNFVGVAGPNVRITSLVSVGTGVKVEKNSSNIATVYANDLGANNYKFAVWSEQNGQDDLIWGEGTPQVNGSAKYVINRADHKNDPGKYFVHVYTMDMRFVGANEIDFGTIKTDELKGTVSGNTISIRMSGLTSPNGAKNVQFAVYSEDNGIDDVIWYDADYKDGVYTKNVNASNHRGTGTYWIHAYLTDNYNTKQFIGGTTVNIGANAGSTGPQVKIDNIGGNQIQVTVTNVGANVTVLTPTWSEQNGQDDIHWYEASRQGDTHVAVINLKNHTGVGTYFVHVYTRDGAGNLKLINGYTFEVRQAAAQPISLNTPIMGDSGTSAQQLVNFYNNNSSIDFPQYYQQRGVSLAQFAQMYVDECKVENVRVDLAFCQAMHETAFLRFGGDVSISQFNFAGLGATGGGVPGENFAAKYGDNANGIRMGIRAQVQHLKAYGSTDPLNQACVDTRFSYVSRGSAKTVSGLSGTWAADQNYANSLVNYMQRIK